MPRLLIKEVKVLSPRSEAILKSIVAQYIVRAVPVPSQNLIDDRELAVSSATIRNEMAHLEEEGYIIRPHPSAGSIPSDKGYRYYVETLGNIRLPSTQQLLIRHLFHQVERQLEEWLSLAASLTAQLAQNVAIVAMPKTANLQLKHLEVISLQEEMALVIVVLHGARLRQQLFTFDQPLAQSELTAMANKLSTAYSGLTREEILAKKMKLSPAEQQLHDCLLNIMQAEDEQESERSYLDGIHFVLNQPEFHQAQRALTLMELVECRRLLRAITPDKMGVQGVQVIIGKENKAEAIQNCSVVISRYGLPEEAMGTIGVVGPTRMPYARTISAVGYLSKVLSQLVAELYGRKQAESNS
jgi:heat-inducible transcriptional repressor